MCRCLILTLCRSAPSIVLNQRKFPFRNGIRNRRRTGRDEETFYYNIPVFFGYLLSIRHAKSRRPRSASRHQKLRAAANTNHYTLSGRKPRQKPPSTIHTRRGLSFLRRQTQRFTRTVLQNDLHRDEEPRIESGTEGTPDVHQLRPAVTFQRTLAGHKERPTYRPPHRAGGRGNALKQPNNGTPPPNRTDT